MKLVITIEITRSHSQSRSTARKAQVVTAPQYAEPPELPEPQREHGHELPQQMHEHEPAASTPAAAAFPSGGTVPHGASPDASPDTLTVADVRHEPQP